MKKFSFFVHVIQNISDWLWVLQAYLRGKMLRQKAYRPNGNKFRFPVSVTTARIMMLIKLWGFRPMTVAELTRLMAESAPKKSNRVPFIEWDRHDQKWCARNTWDRWESNSSFFSIRE